MEAGAVAADSFEDLEGANNVGTNERRRVIERVVVVRFRGEVDNNVRIRHQWVDGVPLGDVALDERDTVQALNGCAVPGIGQLVEHHDFRVGVALHRRVNEIGSDEPGSAGNEDLHDDLSESV